MAFSTKKNFFDAIDGETISEYLNKLDYTLKTSEERIEFVNHLLGQNNFFEKYFQNYFDVHLTKNDFTSQYNNVCMALEHIACYICLGDPSFTNIDRNNKFLPLDEEIEPSTDNFYKSNEQKILDKDFHDQELSPLIDYKSLKNAISEIKKNNAQQKQKINYDKMIGEINKDMLTVKNSIKKPIIFKKCSRSVEAVHWDECDYYNSNHIRYLMVLSKRSLFHSLGVLTYDVEQMIQKVSLTDFERAVLQYIKKNEGVTQEEVANLMGCSKSYINKVLRRIAKKIVNFNFSHTKVVNT